jgi:hypothetical protein
MESEPQQPIEQRHFRLTPEQQAHARREIEQALDNLSEDEPVISTDVARVIAASIHSGPGSILEHFAATNRLNAKVAREEVRDAIARGEHPVWSMALTLYLENLESPLPDLRPVDYQEPTPEVFLRSPSTGASGWLVLEGALSATEVDLQVFDPDWSEIEPARHQIDRLDWEIGNVVGFYGADLRSVPSLRALHRLAQGVNKYGEAFGAYLSIFGADGASRYTYQRLHVGTFENRTELVASFAFTAGLLDPNDTPGEDRTRGPTVNIRFLERSLSEHYSWKQGRSKLHLFARDTLGYGNPQPDQPDE